MDRPLTICNRSISNLSDSSSSQSYSVSTFGSNPSFYKKKKISLSSHQINRHKNQSSNNHKTSSKKKKKKKKKLRRKSFDHNMSDSDLNLKLPRRGFDRQLSLSRWLADAVSEHSGKLRRAVSSHDVFSTQETRPLSDHKNHGYLQSLASKTTTTTAYTADTETDTASTENNPFRLFRRANCHNPVAKPVRKRSSGAEGLINDVLVALSGHSSGHKRSNMFAAGTNSTHSTEEIANLDDDIEEDDTDQEGDEVEFHSEDDDENYETTSTTAISDEASDCNVATTFTTPVTPPVEPLLLQQSSRWDASSPSRENKEKKDASPMDRRCSSSKKMPVPPPPPFSPLILSNNLDVIPSDLFQNPLTEGGDIPNKPHRQSSNDLRDSLTLEKEPTIPTLAAASAAIAIATDDDDGDSFGGESEEEEEEELNDLVKITKRYLQNGNNSNCNSENSSSHDTKTDAATADSTTNTNTNSDRWDDFSQEISVDGVTMVSASNTIFTGFTATTHHSNALSHPTGDTTGSLAAYMNRVSQQREGSKRDHRHNISKNNNSSRNKNKNSGPDLGAFMNWANRKSQEAEEDNEEARDIKKNSVDYSSYWSIAEDTNESACTFATESQESSIVTKRSEEQQQQNFLLRASSDHHPALALSCRNASSIVPPCMPKRQQKQQPLLLRASSDHHPALDLSRRNTSSIVPPCMPKRLEEKEEQQKQQPLPLRASSDHHPVQASRHRNASIDPPCMPKRLESNHEKLDIAPRTPKSTRKQHNNNNKLAIKSPTGNRVKRLLDAANKRKCSSKYVTVNPDRRCSLPATSSPKPKETSFARRRASVDNSILSSSRSLNDGCPPTPTHRQPSITSTITRTPRTSPSLSRSQHRTYHNNNVERT